MYLYEMATESKFVFIFQAVRTPQPPETATPRAAKFTYDIKFAKREPLKLPLTL